MLFVSGHCERPVARSPHHRKLPPRRNARSAGEPRLMPTSRRRRARLPGVRCPAPRPWPPRHRKRPRVCRPQRTQQRGPRPVLLLIPRGTVSLVPSCSSPHTRLTASSRSAKGDARSALMRRHPERHQHPTAASSVSGGRRQLSGSRVRPMPSYKSDAVGLLIAGSCEHPARRKFLTTANVPHARPPQFAGGPRHRPTHAHGDARRCPG